MEFQQVLANLQKAKQAQKKKQQRLLFIAVPIGFVIGLLIAFSEELFSSVDNVYPLYLLAAFLLTMSLQLILHELGHLVFGLVCGYRFVSFRVTSLAIIKKDGKLKLARYRVPGTLGQCLMSPTQNDDVMPYRAMLLGGVLFNAITALLFVIPLVFCYHLTLLRYFSFGMIFCGVTLALSNGIPQKNGAVANDGYHIKILPKDPTARQLFFNQLRIAAATTEGKRLSEMPKEWFTLPPNAPLDPFSATIILMDAEREIDLGKLDSAENILLDLATYGDNLSEQTLLAALAELLYLEMVGKHRRDVIEILRHELERYFKATQNSFSTLRIEIAYHYLFTGDLDKIQRLDKKFSKLKKRFPFDGEVAHEELLINYPKALYESWRNSSQG